MQDNLTSTLRSVPETTSASSVRMMANVPPEKRGIPLHQWRLQQITEQCSEYLRTKDPTKAPLSQQRLWNPRDSYGMKGL
jgi:hypothetical protein